MGSTFFVITCSDGDVSIRAFSASELEDYLQKYYVDDEREPHFLEDPTFAPSNLSGGNTWGNPNWWPRNGIFVIKGAAYIPQAVDVVSKYRVRD